MADGFKDLEEFVMGVLVRERKTAAAVIADANEILGVIVDRCSRVVQSWHYRKGGYTELAEALKALAVDPAQDSTPAPNASAVQMPEATLAKTAVPPAIWNKLESEATRECPPLCVVAKEYPVAHDYWYGRINLCLECRDLDRNPGR